MGMGMGMGMEKGWGSKKGGASWLPAKETLSKLCIF